MASKKKLLQAAAGAAGGAGLDVDEVFSTYLYDGTGVTQVIENGIALGNDGDGGSGNFTAGNTTRVNVATSSNFGFGTGDFTIEFFVYLYSHYNYSEFYDQRTASQDSSTLSPIVYGDSSGRVYFYAGSNLIQSNTNATPVGAWTHVAVTKASGSTKLFINGTQQGSTYSDSNNYVTPASDFSFGGSLEQNTYNVDGFMSNLRVVKGTAVYTSNFTAPTAALTAVSGTSLLTLQGSTPFVDNSGNNVTLTQRNDPVASEFGPFTGTSGEGGLVWIKGRNAISDHALVDTERGGSNSIASNTDAAQRTDGAYGVTFNSNGFTSTGGNLNVNGREQASWTFRKAPKFFDIQTWTGTGSARTISHNLGQVPGVIIVKRYSAIEDWNMFHRSLGNTKYLQINGTGQAGTSGTGGGQANLWNDTDPTATEFTIGTHDRVNTNGENYVAYLFAHNNSDGEFGPNSDQDIIKCGSYTGAGSTDVDVNLGFEPQWLLIKKSSASGDQWLMLDSMRGTVTGGNDNRLFANLTNTEGNASDYLEFTSTGFRITGTSGEVASSGETYIYMAIRRGPLAEPESATDVFALSDVATSVSIPTGFNPDFWLRGVTDGTAGNNAHLNMSRLTDGKYLATAENLAERGTNSPFGDGPSNQFTNTVQGGNGVNYLWKRAPGYFDVCTYTGTGLSSVNTVSHNLGVVPEMIWAKKRSGTGDWNVYHKGLNSGTNPEQYITVINSSNAEQNRNYFNDTAPTATTFQVTDVLNGNTDNYIAYLFASVAGISKVGSVSHSFNSTTNVDCGFSSGARFVLVKSTSSGDWYVWDSVRGIVSGNDPYLALNSNAAQVTNGDLIDPYSGGFALSPSFYTDTYIFYAIA